MIKIDTHDRKILYELDKNSSISLSQLSKKLRRSKQFILYRMKQLEKANIIAGYNAIIDMSKFGYFTFRVYLKFQQMTLDDEKKFVDYLIKEQNQIWTITQIHSKWDYAIFFGVKSISDFHAIWDSILKIYKKNLVSYNVSIYEPIYNFNKSFFMDKQAEPVERVYGSGKREEIDATDLKIIEAFSINVRQSSLQIAKKIGISSDSVRRRIRKLEDKKIIVGYKIGLNAEPLGYVSYRVDLHLSSTERNSEIHEFCKMHKNIYQINKTIGSADFEIEVIVKDQVHLLQVLNEIKERFSSSVNYVEFFGFSVYYILHYIPD